MFTPSLKLSAKMVSQFEDCFVELSRELTLCKEIQASSNHGIEKGSIFGITLGDCVR